MFSLIDTAATKPICLYKPIGLTPLQAVTLYAAQSAIGPDQKLGYAGRLDPLAEGVLLALIGPANKSQANLIGLDKKYRFKVVFGLTTDSYDEMGWPSIKDELMQCDWSRVKKISHELAGEIDQAYPAYSAVQVKGQPLFYWARAGKLAEIEVPVAKRTIFELEAVDEGMIKGGQLLNKVEHDIALVKGDFRQISILKQWREILSSRLETSWPTATFELHCSSGTYVRSLADLIGQQLGCGATTISLIRTAAGPYTIEDCQRLKPL